MTGVVMGQWNTDIRMQQSSFMVANQHPTLCPFVFDCFTAAAAHGTSAALHAFLCYSIMLQVVHIEHIRPDQSKSDQASSQMLEVCVYR
jgi:hypothetical protein